MVYKVKFSETCLEEIDEICDYIENKLKAKKASINLRIKIYEKVSKLEETPEMYEEIEKRERTTRKFYRRITIDNYIILYTIIEEDNVVLISHMYYSGRNYLENLI